MSVAPENRKPQPKPQLSQFHQLINSDTSLDLDSEDSSYLEIAEEFECAKKGLLV